MDITDVMGGLAVSDLDAARRWYTTFFGRGPDLEPMPGLTEWHTTGGTVQLVLDAERAGGSMVTFQVPDARGTLAGLAERGGPVVELDDGTSDKVRFATVTDPDGNALTLVDVRPGVEL
jgi:catechol 2,3-dioxygenase-like lactoylglutathione lyase family enzyme